LEKTEAYYYIKVECYICDFVDNYNVFNCNCVIYSYALMTNLQIKVAGEYQLSQCYTRYLVYE
jgi:hypothetical protein